MTARLHVDWTRCHGRGGCTELLPELFDADPDGFPVRTGPGRGDPVVSRDLRAAARDAVALCPRMALSLLEGRAR